MSRTFLFLFSLVALFAITGMVFAANVFLDEYSFEEWYAPAVNHMRDIGIVQGYPDGKFHPSNNVTRAELAVVLDNLLNNINTATSVSTISPSAIPATSAASTAPQVITSFSNDEVDRKIEAILFNQVKVKATIPNALEKIQVMLVMAESGVKHLAVPPSVDSLKEVQTIDGLPVQLLRGYTLYNQSSIISVSYLHFSGNRTEGGDVKIPTDEWFGPFYGYLPIQP